MSYDNEFEVCTTPFINCEIPRMVPKACKFPPIVEGHLQMQEVSWYNWHADMLALSNEYPEVLFEVTRHGEDAMDSERRWYKNGKCRAWELPAFEDLCPKYEDAKPYKEKKR